MSTIYRKDRNKTGIVGKVLSVFPMAIAALCLAANFDASGVLKNALRTVVREAGMGNFAVTKAVLAPQYASEGMPVLLLVAFLAAASATLLLVTTFSSK